MTPSRHQTALQAQLRSIASLAEPVRQTLYRFVVERSQPVSREEAAVGVGVAHHVAKFHLDKLEEDGLLEVDYHRPAGRTGPGAGRPAKFYRRAAGDIAVSLPERRYELPGRLMAEAITASADRGESVSATLQAAAHATGERLGRQAREVAGPAAGTDELVTAICGVLDAEGYEPRATSDRITLANCPFFSLAQEYTGLVCGMNLDLMCGLVDSLRDERLQAHLDPAAGRCCVTFTHG